MNGFNGGFGMPIAPNRAEEVEYLVKVFKDEGIAITKDDIIFFIKEVYNDHSADYLSALSRLTFDKKEDSKDKSV